MKTALLTLIAFFLITAGHTTLFADDYSPFTVTKPTIKQGIHASGWEKALVAIIPPQLDKNNADDDSNSDDDTIWTDYTLAEETDDTTLEIDDKSEDDNDFSDNDNVEYDEVPEDEDLMTLIPSDKRRKWGEWYGSTPPLDAQTDFFPKQADSVPIKQAASSPLLTAAVKPKNDALLDGFSLSLWGDSSLVINAGANYTWKYLYSAVSFGTDLYTPAFNRPYFLDIRTGGSYPFSSFLVRTDIGYRINLNQQGEGSSHFKQHQFEFRAAAGYRLNPWLLLIGG
ncbi:hypothetical protein KAH37_06420, partial [bacterium]|nr:hypothetical protein [bacterium]